MAIRNKSIFLGRGGRVFGPYTEDQVGHMRLSGEIESYTYIWDEDSSGWFNLDPVPPAPGAESSQVTEACPQMGGEAICHNSKDIVAGLLENVSDMGCDLISHDPSESPKLGINSSLVLNVLDRSGGLAVNVRARLVDSRRRAGKWVYRIRWAKRPSF